MQAKLKKLFILSTMTLSFIFSNSAQAQDPVEGCWNTQGKFKATASARGRSVSRSYDYADILCFNADNTFEDSNGYGTWTYQKKKYILNYDLSSLDAALAPLTEELQLYFDNVRAAINSAAGTLKFKNAALAALKGTENFKGKGSLEYIGRTIKFKFGIQVSIKKATPLSPAPKSVADTQGLANGDVHPLGAILQASAKDLENLLQQAEE